MDGRIREKGPLSVGVGRRRVGWHCVVPAKVDTGGRQLAPDGQKLAGPAATARDFPFFFSFFLSFLFRRRRRSSLWAARASRSLISTARTLVHLDFRLVIFANAHVENARFIYFEIDFELSRNLSIF